MSKKFPRLLYTVLLIMVFLILFFVLLSVTADIRRIAFRSLRPIFYGAVIAYLFKPMCNFFEKRYLWLFQKKLSHQKSRSLAHYLSIITTYIIFGLIIYLLIFFVLPQVIKGLVQVVASIPSFIQSFIAFFNSIVINNEFIAENLENILKALSDSFTAWYQSRLLPIIGSLADGMAITLTFIINLFIGFIVSVYLLNGRKKLCAQCKLVIKGLFNKKQANAIFEEAKFADSMFSGYFVGALIDSSLVGIICYVLCLVTGMPFALLVSVIVGVANIIPFFGPYIGLVPSAIIILSVSPIKALIFVVMIWVLQQIDGNILAPKIIGSNTGLSSFWVLFAILLFGGLFGFFGMIIGAPVFAIIYDICGRIIRDMLKTKGEEKSICDYETEFLSKPIKKALLTKHKAARASSYVNTDKQISIQDTTVSPDEQKSVKNAFASSNEQVSVKKSSVSSSKRASSKKTSSNRKQADQKIYATSDTEADKIPFNKAPTAPEDNDTLFTEDIDDKNQISFLDIFN